ncbi:MAG: 6-phosphofructokinase, partial [Ignavibacteriales bacterium]|nr:6-phosphofructokinase [Ignavibacteriales bacterium]
RILSTKFGVQAISLAMKKNFDRMVALNGDEIKSVKISEAIARQKLVKKTDQAVQCASAVGVSFGVEKF